MIAKSNYISILNREVRNKDDLEGKKIAEIIERYEQVNGCEITEVRYCVDNMVRYHCIYVDPFGEPTFRILGSPRVFESALRYYIGYDIKVLQCQYIFKEIFNNKDWDEFNEGQIKFEDNIMYFSIY